MYFQTKIISEQFIKIGQGKTESQMKFSCQIWRCLLLNLVEPAQYSLYFRILLNRTMKIYDIIRSAACDLDFNVTSKCLQVVLSEIFLIMS